MDLSKAYYCLNHEMLLAKLHAYGFNRTALKHIHSYLTEKQQRLKFYGTLNNLKCSSKGVPQSSALGLSYSIFILMTSFT